MKRLYLYVVNPFHDHGHIFVCALDYFCRSQSELQRRAAALEKALNVKSVDKYIVRLSKIEDVQPVQGELPF